MTASLDNTLWPVDVLARVVASTSTGRFLIVADGRTIDVHIPTWASTRGLRRRLGKAERGLRRAAYARLVASLAAADLQLRVLLRGRELAHIPARSGVLAATLSLGGMRIRPFGVLAALLISRPHRTPPPHE